MVASQRSRWVRRTLTAIADAYENDRFIDEVNAPVASNSRTRASQSAELVNTGSPDAYNCSAALAVELSVTTGLRTHGLRRTAVIEVPARPSVRSPRYRSKARSGGPREQAQRLAELARLGAPVGVGHEASDEGT